MAVGEPAFVLPTIGRTLGATNGVAEHVDEKRMLLLLDNLEHVLGVAPDLSELLARCQNLHLLATSRRAADRRRARVRGTAAAPA